MLEGVRLLGNTRLEAPVSGGYTRDTRTDTPLPYAHIATANTLLLLKVKLDSARAVLLVVVGGDRGWSVGLAATRACHLAELF